MIFFKPNDFLKPNDFYITSDLFMLRVFLKQAHKFELKSKF